MGPPTILIVEDEGFVRVIAADMLEESGFRALEAGSADEALELLKRHDEIDVLFTDINMPGSMDGLQLARRVADERPGIKVIVTSGKQWVPIEQLPGGGLFLPKPYRTSQLAKLVEEQISKH